MSHRRILDSTGYNSKTIPSKTFEHSVRNHCGVRRSSVAELLVYNQVLRDVGAVSPGTSLTARDADYQSFKGTKERPACHVMHTLMLYDGKSPQSLINDSQYQRRMINLFARCTLQDVIVNKIDKLVDDEYGREVQIQATRMVLQGASAAEAYKAYATKLKEFHGDLADQLKGLSSSSAIFGRFMDLSADLRSYAPNEDKLLEMIDDKGVRVVEIYEAEAGVIPPEVQSPKLVGEVNSEKWSNGSAVAPPIAPTKTKEAANSGGTKA